mgnify:CR=1 FL=1
MFKQFQRAVMTMSINSLVMHTSTVLHQLIPVVRMIRQRKVMSRVVLIGMKLQVVCKIMGILIMVLLN